MVNYLNILRRFRRDVRLFVISTALLGFTYFGIYALLLNLYLHRLGYGPAFVGLVNAAGPLAFVFCSLPAGALSQRWSSRRALMLGYSLEALALGLLPIGEFMPSSWHAGWLVATYTLAWVGGTFFVVNTGPFLMSATTEQERNHAFALQSAVLPLAGFAGNLLGGLLPGLYAALLGVSLDQPAPYRYSLWLAAVLLCPAVLAIQATHTPRVEQRQAAVAVATEAPYLLILVMALVMLLQTAGGWIMRVFFNVYLDAELHAATPLIGSLSAAGQLLGVMALAAPLVIARFDKVRTIGWGIVGMACSLVLLVFIVHWGAVGLAFMGIMAFSSLTGTTFAVFSQELVPPAWRTTMAGALTMALGVGIAAVALGGGYLIAIWGYQILFLAGVGLNLASALLFFAHFRKGHEALAGESIPKAAVSTD